MMKKINLNGVSGWFISDAQKKELDNFIGQVLESGVIGNDDST